MKVKNLQAVGRVPAGGRQFVFFRSKDGKAIPPLPNDSHMAGPAVGYALPVTDYPEWVKGGDYVVWGCDIDDGSVMVHDHVVCSAHMGTPNAWLVQSGQTFQGTGARDLMPDDFDWERSVDWTGHIMDARLAIKRHMLVTFPEVGWAILWRDRTGKIKYDGQSDFVGSILPAIVKEAEVN